MKPYDGSTPFEQWRNAGRHSDEEAFLRSVRARMERCVMVAGLTKSGQRQTGSGVVIETGLVMTNWHTGVESKNDQELFTQVLVNDRPAELVQAFSWGFVQDVIVLKAETRKLASIPFADIDMLKRHGRLRGLGVFCISNPDEYIKSVLEGIITWESKTRLRTDIPPAMGTSGGALYVKRTGQLIGIVDRVDGSEEIGCAFTEAVPSPLVKRFYLDALHHLRFRKE
jgi:hypothetical protein